MKTITVWAVTSNTDLTEGRGYEYDVGYFNTHEHAINAVSDKRYSKFCGMGVQSPYDTNYKIHERVFNVYDSPTEFFNEHDIYTRLKGIRDKLGTEDMEFLVNNIDKL